MDPMNSGLGRDERSVVCPNCGNRQAISGIEQRCDQCGFQFDVAASGDEGIVGGAMAGEAFPTDVAPPMAAGGIGGVSDGTQVVHRATSAVPGKPMAPIADDPAGGSSLEGQAMDTPVSAPHSERGGSG